MKYLILVKHSLPSVIEDKPAREWNLSDEGRTRAQILAEKLAPYQPEVIISSVEPKAVQTAEIVAHFLGLQMHMVENLHEHDRSKTAYLARDAFESMVREFFDKPNELIFGSETANQAHQRFREAMDSVLHQHKNQTVVIVAHGTVISLFVSRLTGTPEFPLWKELGLPSFVVVDLHSKALIARENIV